ncbi:hypothetical protein ScalyP_jg1356 [Parmales sp. scaly parma]|nr:hypothetical protein ScalyP_jg1356 [Parmales sp. scaly parma]
MAAPIPTENSIPESTPSVAANYSIPKSPLMIFMPTEKANCKNWRWWLSGLRTPLFVTICYLFVGMYLNCVIQVYAQYRANKQPAQQTLPDLGFDILPNIDPVWADVMCYSAMAITFVRFTFGIDESGHRIRRHIFRRHIFNLGTLFIFRSISIIVTLLPNPLESCETDVEGSPWIEAFRIVAGRTVTCADVMYSGHTVNITLCAMTWFSYSHVVPILDWDPIFSRFGRLTNKLGDLERWTTVKLLCWIYATIGYICIVGSRFHYSLDVFIGLLLTVCFYKFHYDVIRIAHLRKTKIMKLLCWLEKDAEDLKWYRQYLSQVNDAVVYIGGEQENLRTSSHGELPSSTELAASVV